MKTSLRHLSDKTFTGLSALSVVLMSGALVLILGPLLWRGSGAIVFKGTVEFRKMQYDMHGRGSRESLDGELAEAEKKRKEIYKLLDGFSEGIDTTSLQKQAKHVYRQFKTQLRNRIENGTLTDEKAGKLKSVGKKLRNRLLEAYRTTDRDEAFGKLDYVLKYSSDQRFRSTVAERFFELARSYRKTASTIDLTRRDEYVEALAQVQDIVRQLLGPRGKEVSLAQFRYGATRWDRTQILLKDLVWAEQWVAQGDGKPLKKVCTKREKQFAGTELAALFSIMERDIELMLRPRRTFYWQYFIDDSIPGHFFGGIGPEILGTLLLTVLAMVFALPLGITAAAYLIECAGDNMFVRIIRTCINTLAGVPSVVFGLFGLAFFVLYLQPMFGMKGRTILAGAMTLSVLILPVIIRASEEAIRAVPRSYKEASLALGAGKFRTFMTVTMPAAAPGILTGVILSMSRAAGETAPILFTAAIALGPIPENLAQPTKALSYGAYDIAIGDRIAELVPHQQYGMVAGLIMLVLVLNLTAIIIRHRLEVRLRGH